MAKNGFTNGDLHVNGDLTVNGSAPSGAAPYIRLHDSKATTTAGGTFTQDAWQKRTVTEDIDTGNHCSVAASVITLDAGTYEFLIQCPAYSCNNHQARLYNTSDTAVVEIGSNGFSHNSWGDYSLSIIQGRVVIGAEKNFEIQHYCQNTKTTDGFGKANSFGLNETYVVAEFRKVG